MCSNRVLWLLSYIGLSVALALGNNRQSAALEPSRQQQQQQYQRQQYQHQQQQHQKQHQMREAVHDWLMYEKRAGPVLGHERLILLDDVLTSVLGNLAQQQQQQQTSRPRARQLLEEPVARPSRRSSRVQQQQQQQQQTIAKRRNPVQSDKSSAMSKRRISASRRQQMPQQDPQEAAQALAQAGSSMAASSFMFNSRNDHSYDVPLIECPMSEDGMERFACPTADRMGRYHCIDDHVLCDGYLDCPMGEDEDMQACMFYRTTKAHIDILADALLRWARGR